MKKDHAIFLFVVGLVAFNWPFMTIFADALPLYLFAAWSLFILIQAVSALFRREEGD